MDNLSTIRTPIYTELQDFIALFDKSLTHEDGLLGQALEHVRAKGGKRMRPILILLMTKSFGTVTPVAQYAAVGLELLHTASLVHDDVVDESGERRGQASVNASYNNKVAVLVGDYILSTALLSIARTNDCDIVCDLAELGRTLSNGEILQLTNIVNTNFSEEVYFEVIRQKTAALFESCAVIGAKAGGADKQAVEAARAFGRNVGIIFQIRDDIFDYYQSADLGKPTGNDMAEGKLTLPVLYALNTTGDTQMAALARKVKARNVSAEEIAQLVEFTKNNGGIAYAERKMAECQALAIDFIDQYVADTQLKNALKAYVDFIIDRKN
ncbi:polyprenyl synthetase family protein [Hoylesella loescheii]|uniref:Polyprenyl synthetase n=1 Tax=Hoylesella loescheii DSM 19665 = JCM 12249 = ATCC 15930 TaxID=1122985 RepID=A0A069QJM8_HOYLO|nr:polyprenyl synthetase family protein [Hoylesella loescheii]KDR53048.1 polyprenyl synthetase [Hoylesella loescheii DSM 19665 = JCM 12249 = ATCC 15930]